jgi:peroxiredoxin
MKKITILRWPMALSWLVAGVSLSAWHAVAVPTVLAADGPADREISAFTATAVDGRPVELKPSDAPRLTVVCFLGTECPLARLYGPRLAALADEYRGRGIEVIGIDSNVQDSAEEIRAYADSLQLAFPILDDANNVLADRFAAERTPEAFIVDHRLVVRYHGRIDDQYQPGIVRNTPGRADLRIALDELLAGKPVTHTTTEVSGCLIGRVTKQPDDASQITYCSQVARILQRHCVECHRPGDIGPRSLTDYQEILGWAETMVEVIDQGRMPPWHATGDHLSLANARSMPESEKQMLRDWVAAGMPYGDESALPPAVEYSDGWQLPREPDLVLSMPKPFIVPAGGTVEYQYFVVDPQFDEDQWVRAAQVVPGNRSVVHHGVIFVRPPDGSRFRGVGWLSAYVPGQRAMALKPGQARKIPAGSKLVFQMHYTPNGVEQSDLTKVGIVLENPNQVTHEVFTLLALDQEFEIPPHAAAHAVKARTQYLPKNAELLAIAPHMHLRGKAFQAFAVHGDAREPLLHVPHYDFNWQHIYQLAEPMSLSAVDRLEIVATFDNSADNPVNPDPAQRVTWGDQTWEEMAVAFFEVSEPRQPPPETVRAADPPAALAVQQESPELRHRLDAFTADFIKRFDANHDGLVDREETPLSIRRFGFWDFDRDGDEQLTAQEIRDAARWRFESK